MTKKWSEFPAGGAVSGTDVTVGLQGGVNVQGTQLQAATYFWANPQPNARAVCAVLGVPFIVGQSNAAVSNTGSTAEFTFATIVIPAGSMGANGIINVNVIWSFSGAAGTRVPRVYLGSTAFETGLSAASTVNSFRTIVQICNNNSATAQKAMPANFGTGTFLGTSSAALTTGAEDTSGALNLTIRGALTSAADTMILESYSVELLYRA